MTDKLSNRGPRFCLGAGVWYVYSLALAYQVTSAV
jgi:hypothetical protein